MRNLLCQSSQDYKYVIKFVEEQSDDFINDEYVKYLRKYNLDSNRALELAEQMWFVIAAKTDGQAYHLLRFLEGNEDGHRGVMAWYRLRSSAMGVSTNRLQALNARVNTPERVEKFEDLHAAVECWEADVREYELATNTKINDVMRMGGFLQLVPKNLAIQIRDSPTILDYDDAKRYLLRKIDQCKSPWTRGSVSVGSKDKHAMDIGQCADDIGMSQHDGHQLLLQQPDADCYDEHDA